ncbi:FAD-dependent oxidoreductase [Pseudonocardiaceae bacterium YIM PH 21723]|nr:FAD-dependent oxidoreductase [Pseudonocardiaceae bacterium YIM PH 21723]
MTQTDTVVVIGAGPVGLAAAAHLLERGLKPVVLEAGTQAGSAVRDWGHVQLFSPWRFNIAPAARRLLEPRGWVEPDLEALPSGAQLVEQYLNPLAAALGDRVQLDSRVVAVSRSGVDKVRTVGRDEHPYLVRVRSSAGEYRDILAKAVIDASGTWGRNNPLGVAGLAAPGEAEAEEYLAGSLPDVLGRDRERFAGKHALVVGMGHSAANTLLALAELARTTTGTTVTWAIRAARATRLYGGGDADGLPARGALGTRLKELVDTGAITLITEFTIDRFERGDGPLSVIGRSADGQLKLDVDVVVGATGFRPDLDMLREVRLDLDPGIEAPAQLAPLVDPNFHSCGTVPPHGERQLVHPDAGFYIAGMKSYGRAPTFLMATGYEQVRSIAAALAGDRAAADAVELDLPETGVCSTDLVAEDSGCCGPAEEPEASACCPPAAVEPEPAACCGTAPEPVKLGFTTGVEHGYSGDVVRS